MADLLSAVVVHIGSYPPPFDRTSLMNDPICFLALEVLRQALSHRQSFVTQTKNSGNKYKFIT